MPIKPIKKARNLIREKRKCVNCSQWFCQISLACVLAAILTNQVAYAFFDIAFAGELSTALQQAKVVWNVLMYFIPGLLMILAATALVMAGINGVVAFCYKQQLASLKRGEG